MRKVGISHTSHVCRASVATAIKKYIRVRKVPARTRSYYYFSKRVRKSIFYAFLTCSEQSTCLVHWVCKVTYIAHSMHKIHRSSSSRRDTSFSILTPRYVVLHLRAEVRSSSAQPSIYNYIYMTYIVIYSYMELYTCRILQEITPNCRAKIAKIQSWSMRLILYEISYEISYEFLV